MLLLLELRWRARYPGLLVPLVTVLLAVDLIYASRDLNPTIPNKDLFPRTQLTDYLRAIEPAPRVNTAMAAIPGGFPLPYGIEQWGGYDGIYPERMMSFQEDLGTQVWKNMEPVCSVEILLHDPRYPHDFPVADPGRFTLLTSLEGIEVYRNNLAFPRAFLVGGLEFLDRDGIFKRMVADGYDPARYVVAQPTNAVHEVPESLRVDSSAMPATPAGGLPVYTDWRKSPEGMRDTFTPFAGKATVISRTSTRIVVETEAERDAVLVLTDSYYPGWEATIDGEPVEIFPAYYAFRGLILPAGKHVVEYVYHPASFVWGLRITLAALVLLVLVAWATRKPRRAPGDARA